MRERNTNIVKSLFLILTFFVSYQSRAQWEQNKVMKFVSLFGNFTMETPKEWKYIRMDGFYDFEGKIAINKTDTLRFNYGWWSSSLSGDKLLFSLQDTEIYLPVKIYKDKIDGYYAYVVTPEITGINMCRIYIDSLYKNYDIVTKFDLRGDNLTKESQKQFLKAIRTLKFEREKYQFRILEAN